MVKEYFCKEMNFEQIAVIAILIIGMFVIALWNKRK